MAYPNGALQGKNEAASAVEQSRRTQQESRTKPIYGHAIAKYIVEELAAGGGPLRIFEIGAGNGTLMVDVLDFLRDHEPQIYARVEYTVIEISQRLNAVQRARAAKHGHSARVRFVAKSIFDWSESVPNEAFFLAMEVLVLRGDPAT